MIDPSKVLGFLDLAGAWDASLLFVLGAATGVATAAFRLLLKRSAPLLDTRFHLPVATAADKRLLIGAAIFGVGWGWAGYRPGPPAASLEANRMPFAPASSASWANTQLAGSTRRLNRSSRQSQWNSSHKPDHRVGS
jgi:hypothetical protein